jgi:hypothetical protein
MATPHSDFIEYTDACGVFFVFHHRDSPLPPCSYNIDILSTTLTKHVYENVQLLIARAIYT